MAFQDDPNLLLYDTHDYLIQLPKIQLEGAVTHRIEVVPWLKPAIGFSKNTWTIALWMTLAKVLVLKSKGF